MSNKNNRRRDDILFANEFWFDPEDRIYFGFRDKTIEYVFSYLGASHLSYNSSDSNAILKLLKRVEKGYQPSAAELKSLRKTESVVISDFGVTELPKAIGQLSSLEGLYIFHRNFTTLPETIGNIVSLQTLFLHNCNITALPETIGNLKSLHSLVLSEIRITALPETIGNLKSLHTLILSESRITALPETIGNLRSLRTLVFNNGGFTALPETIGNLKSLQTLFFRARSITKLPETIGNLTSLQMLDLSDNSITELPKTIANLTSLQSLSIANTMITVLPKSVKQLVSLRKLSLDYTNIIKLPEWLGELPKLDYLGLRGLTLDSIPRSLALYGLPFVAKRNPPYSVGRCVNLYDTTLTGQDISIFLETPELIPSLYEDQITLPECKVIFLGDGDSGKTYTIRRFRNKGRKEAWWRRYTTKETPGVEIADCGVTHDGGDFAIHFWDFGGQQLLHSMHRCFLTEKTCYVVTVKSREAKSNLRARYWLKNVAAFAPKSPVLLYVNCWDNDDGQRAIDESKLRREFPQIVDVVYCSAKEADTTFFREQFMEKLIDMAADSDGCRQTVNRKWSQARQAIEAENRDYLTKERYHQICQENGIKDDHAAGLLSFFNNLGVCFSYHRDEERKELAEYKLLNPVWLTNAIYAIIEEGRAGAQGLNEGRITDSQIIQMLCNPAPTKIDGKSYRRTVPGLVYKKQECSYIVDVAAAHNLCYRVDRETLFFPALCSNNTPSEALDSPEEYPQHVEYLLQYSYLPDSVVHQLVIRCLKKELVVSSCWLRGFVLGGMDVHKAFIHMEEDDQTLRIDIYSKPDHPAYDLFSLLREEINAVNETLNLKADEFVVDGDDKYTVVSLLKAVSEKIPVVGPTTGKICEAEILLGRFYPNRMIQWIRVENGTIIVPIIPREFHKRDKSDKLLRRALFEAYNEICPYCKRPFDNIREIQVDHILPTKYKEKPELTEYINYLGECGFDIEKPDYIENYLPAHPSCNLDKSAYVDCFALIACHGLATKKTKRVLDLIEKYKDQSRYSE